MKQVNQNGLRGLGAYETTLYLRGDVFADVDFLLSYNLDTSNDEGIELVVTYVYEVLTLVANYLKLIPEYIDLVSNIDLRLKTSTRTQECTWSMKGSQS